MFIVLMVGSQVAIIVRSIKGRKLDWSDLLPLMLLGVFSINGMFEMTALLGKFMFIGAFLALIAIVRNTERD